MNTRLFISSLCLAFVSLGLAHAQGPERGERPPGPRSGNENREAGRRGSHPDGFRPPPHPLMDAIDTDGDHVLSADEIANAAKSLRSLDANADGELSREELRPRLGEGERGRRRGPRGEEGRAGGPGEGGPRREGGPRGARGDGARGDGPRGEGGPRDREFGERGPRGPGGPEGRRPPGGGGERTFDAERFVERIMKFDEDEDGQISMDELPERMQRMVEKGDVDEDGVLSKQEVLEMVSARVERGELGGRGGRDQKPQRPKRPQ